MITRVTQFFIDRYQLTIVLFLMLAVMGGASWASIPKAEDPAIPIPTYIVVAVYPGAQPADVEQLVVDPIEEAMGELDALDQIRSDVQDGVAVMRIEFQPEEDADDKYGEVVREINALRPDLPADLHSLDVRKVSASEVNIAQVALVSEVMPYHELEQRAERLEERLEQVPGVKSAEAWAFPEREVGVSLDLGRLSQLGIAPGQVLQAIGSDNANVPGGTVDAGSRRFNVETSGEYASLDEVRNTVVRAAGGNVTFLRDVADVDWSYGDPTHVARFNGRRAVFVTVAQKDGADVGKITRGV